MKQQYGVNPNVYLRDYDPNTGVFIPKMLEDFLSIVAVEYHHYVFELQGDSVSGGTKQYHLCHVQMGGSTMGTVWTGINNQGVGQLRLANKKVAASLQRIRNGRACRATNNVKRAAALFREFFGVPHPIEAMRGASKSVLEVANDIRWGARPANQTVQKALTASVNYVMDNWHAIKDAAVANGLSADLATVVPEKWEEAVTADACAARVSSGRGVTLHEAYGNLYACNAGNTATARMVPKDNLPDDVRNKYNMLRMVADHNYIMDVGFKDDEKHIFWIDTEEQLSENK